MQRYSWLLLSILTSMSIIAQEQKTADSLKAVLSKTSVNDTSRFEILYGIIYNEMNDRKQGVKYADELIRLSIALQRPDYTRMGYLLKGTKLRELGNFNEALKVYFLCAELARKSKNIAAEGEAYCAIADTYSDNDNHDNAVKYYNQSISYLRKTDSIESLASVLTNTGDEFRKVEKYDSALIYFEEAKIMFEKANHETGVAYTIGNIGMAYAGIGKNTLAEQRMNEAIAILEKSENYSPICDFLLEIANLYVKKKERAEALKYALRSLTLAQQYELKKQISDASLKVAELYELQGNSINALKYYKQGIDFRDSVINIDTVQAMADLRTNFEVSQKQTEVNLLNLQQKTDRKWRASLVVILCLTLLVLGILYKNYQNKQKAYHALEAQKKETDAQKLKAEHALDELQQTQKQLIQSAKMASLGELTTGIAHEIQNPLNFVNNFADLSVELLKELNEGVIQKLTGDDKEEATDIIGVLHDNFKKINDHGKRADSIVKGMLQHSRTNPGNIEMVDINALVQEYLKLSYQGIRVKDKAFKAEFVTHPDQHLQKVEVNPQHLGQVLLNLYNNAFYAVNKKASQDAAFEPLVEVSTNKSNAFFTITVKDNGTGIDPAVIDKVFQPFFTTKPTGQGTGLGLSISYDIIKSYGGDLSVASVVGTGTTFTVKLPLLKHVGMI